MKIEDCAYLAGVVDGEGCIMIGKSRSPNTPIGFQYKAVIEITMCERNTIQYIFDKFPCNPICERILPSGKTAYKLLWTNSKAAYIVESILPFLRGKKAQALVCLEFQKLAPGRGKSYTTSGVANAERLLAKIKWLKTAEALRC